MADALTRVMVDCSAVVKWKIPTEDHATAAEGLFGDWEQQVVDVAIPNHFPFGELSLPWYGGGDARPGRGRGGQQARAALW